MTITKAAKIDTSYYIPDDLTPEISHHIFSFMSPSDLVNLSVTSHRYNADIREFLFTIDKTDAVWSLEKFVKFAQTYSLKPHQVFETRPTLTLKFPNSIEDFKIWELLQVCPNLQKLDLSNCKNVDCFSLTTIYLNLPRLTHLNLSDSKIDDSTLIEILKKHNNLESLNISGCDKLSNFEAIATHCKDLRELQVSGSPNFNDESLLKIINSCPKLTLLDLSDCHLTPPALSAISTCKNLKYLDLENVEELNDDALTQIMENCSSLMGLRISGCQSLTSDCFNKLLHENDHLTAAYIDRCTWVTDKTLSILSKKFPDLKYLDIKSRYVTDTGIGCILERCKNLCSLRISNIFLSAETFMGFSGFKNLTSLNLSFMENLNDDTLIQIVEQNPKLIDLKLKTTSLTPRAYEAIAKNCHRLKSLDLSYSPQLTLEMLIPMIGPNCKKLVVKECDSLFISETEYENILKKHPKLIIHGIW